MHQEREQPRRPWAQFSDFPLKLARSESIWACLRAWPLLGNRLSAASQLRGFYLTSGAAGCRFPAQQNRRFRQGARNSLRPCHAKPMGAYARTSSSVTFPN